MTDEDRALAVIMRQAQWLLDDLAHHLPAGRVSAEKRVEAADLLDQVAQLLRAGTHQVIDAEGR